MKRFNNQCFIFPKSYVSEKNAEFRFLESRIFLPDLFIRYFSVFLNNSFTHLPIHSFYTSPEKPINANARIPAVTSAIGIPFIPLGTFARAICSRMPEKITRASAKPTAVAIV